MIRPNVVKDAKTTDTATKKKASSENKRRTEQDAPRQARKRILPRLDLSWLNKKRLRHGAGIFLMLFAVYLLISFSSHLIFAGNADASVLETFAGRPAENEGGYFGAFFSNLLITRGFGLIAVTFPPYLFLLGYAIVEDKYWGLIRRIFPNFLFVVYWTSTTLAFVKIVFDLPFMDMGGSVGLSVNEWFGFFIGKVGVGLTLILSLLMYASYTFNKQLNVFGFVSSWFARIDQNFAPPDDMLHDLRTGNRMTVDETTEPTIDRVPDSVDDEYIILVRHDTPLQESEELQSELDMPSELLVVEPSDISPVSPKANKKARASEPSIGVEFIIDDQCAEEDAEISLMIPTPSPEHDFLLDKHRSGMQFVLDDEPINDNIEQIDLETYVKKIEEVDEELEIEALGDWDLFDPTRELSRYQYPTVDLLKQTEYPAKAEVDREELEANKLQIINTLGHYGIEIKSIKATIGPTITLYEIVPAPGVRISKIKNLEDDIALSLAALGIRIIAPMPGKGTIGIEIPNSKPEIVSFRSVISTERFRQFQGHLPIVIGKTISNEIYVTDLTKMPHLLVAGATGQGKSVGLNCIIASLLYKKHPSQIKFVLIDPKKVEMSLYQLLEKHFLAKLPNYDDAIITDNKQVIHVLQSLCQEMDDRYKLLQEARVRHITEYNDKFKQRRLNPHKGHRYLPYIVLVIDELADLMLTAGKEIETPIARLAQLARAVGIHLVVATQRPSVNVITGIIKANFPGRMSYRVTQKIDSRTILDANGAEQLIGRGDVLLAKDGEIIRIQNAFIDTDEVERVVEFISKQQGYHEPYYLPEVKDEDSELGGSFSVDEKDALFEEAARLIVGLGAGSTSSIQQHLKIGYNRAARIMIQLEKAGVVGSNPGANKSRELLVRDLLELEQYLRKLG